jgi:hypothetical protein
MNIYAVIGIALGAVALVYILYSIITGAFDLFKRY